MLVVEKAGDLAVHEGRELGTSRWVEVSQADIDQFAQLTGDDNWIHLDTARAAREMPGGRTIAHGLYILSLGPVLLRDIFEIRKRGRGLNYGYDRVRFIAPVPVGSRIRLNLSLISAAKHPMGTRIETEAQFEIEGEEKPALLARNILLITDA